jgi:hypothetical protein
VLESDTPRTEPTSVEIVFSSTGLSTTIKYVRRTASGAAGNGLGTTIKYLRRKRNGFADNGLGNASKYL